MTHACKTKIRLQAL